MRIITCAGFYRTGSSAVTDFFSEFKNCMSPGIFEFRFAHEPDGLSDLEYNICEVPHRHNTSFAIKRFLKYSGFLNGNILMPRYSKYFGKDYMKYTEMFIDEITQLKCKTWWYRDQLERGKLFYFIDALYAKLSGLFNKNHSNISLLKNEPSYYTAISKEEFYAATKRYTNRLFSRLNVDNADFIMLDQLVPPTNIDRYLNYFDDIKVICVERDPRDQYLLEKTKHHWGIIPYSDVHEFCEWFKITREHKQSPESEKIMYIYFEDMIYKYEETTKKLMDFVGLHNEDHIRPKTVFIPEQSINNTKLYKNYPQYEDDIAIIERELNKYLFQEVV